MKFLWKKLSSLTRYYIVSMTSFFIFWGILALVQVEFANSLFFIMSFIWHFTLLTPGIKEKMLSRKQKYSFLNVIVRTNYYLQLFIKIDKIPFGPSIVRSFSPLLFTFILILVGGNGHIVFAILGSIAFELTHSCFSKYIISNDLDESETPPAIPSVENFHE